MQDLNLFVIFARVVESGSFAEAARKMRISRSAVSKAISKLEKSLGAQLLNRSTRVLSLTEAGTVLAEHSAHILDEAEQAERVVNSLQAEPRGMLKVSASVAFGTLHVAPALADFLSRYPEIRIDLTITDRPVDLIGEGYDVIIRVTNEPDLNLVARKLAPVRRKLCATPQYFEKNGVPQTPEDLIKHNCLDYTLSGEQGYWNFTGPEGVIAVPVSGTLRINDDDALSQAVLGGLGIALLPTFTVGKDLQSGKLQAVLSEYIPVERYVYACYLPSRHVPAKVRSFIEFLLMRIGTIPYWDQDA
ncbi:LysR family transcriptional regulator [Nitrosomonas sp.]|uniref:LysR family transcriptional regulator n=1 Tax=Nitrosomonas sp. TaxID=42353 RepID=UPI001E1ABB70|nr:LysR family transcriptional regulator [Nitrosomonas sp.]MCB1949174.1 LysR family transcriptional regulator [Nitrosomonas sp.]MCP5242480.1 LysR family transcriptional regulator [Burkholderiales bacterium]MDR4515305.1 LysR family transcriptional regulator [Nitrosomonas sp.]